ncbi:tetratricopeptide repeat protein [Palleronia sp. LCG004]|uniref:tetratricopeptide repeat protein n=1 Tax=Palleronia sp. LCG004 TaxID=3079304 RepID=UPI002942334B|nr:tetratricopeptide repeat protein [Palleronia sp. LCG004]WOI58418.1 tetratricopeptide repeat protein [Palleronia sp. LCG004]
MAPSRLLRLSLLILGLGVLVACEDPEDAAERYYQSALSLLEAGDVDRAMVELRNVFDNDGQHQEARALYADLLVQQGNTSEAYSQYLRLVEQSPDNAEARRMLAGMALDLGNWTEFERHAGAAVELEPDQPSTQALQIALDYREAMLDRDEPEAAAAAERARALLEADPDLTVARRILIDWLVQGPDAARALPEIDLALEEQPTSRSLQMTRLSVLGRLDDDAATEEQLRHMYELFPDDEQISGYLISWYISTGNLDAAEEFLRAEAGPDDAAPEGHLTVVELLGERDGPEASLAELDRLTEANAETELGRLYASEAAALRFRLGQREEGLAQIEQVVETATSTERRLEAKMALSQMRAAMDETDAAFALVDEILAEDPSHVDALKVRGAREIREGSFGDAISNLRTALGQAPTDAEIMILLAEAQQKSGNIELSQQQLAQAVEVSNAAPGPSLIYAQFLEGQGNLSSAETVLTNAQSASPGNLDVAAALGRVLLQRDRLAEAGALAQRLQQLDVQRARQMAQALQAQILFRQNRVDESLSFLQSQVDEGGSTGEELAATLQLLRLQVQSNRLDEARSTIARLGERYPESQAVQILQADLLSLEGRTDEAIASYRDVLAENPDSLPVVERLYRLLRQQNLVEEADALVRDSLEIMPEARSLQLVEAGRLEREGDIEGAIAIYEQLYEADSDDLIVANNLASLLSVHREDQASLDRAHQISLRLTGAREPAFQDTLGWIQVQRGDIDAAIGNLQAAARGLPQEPSVALHLGLAYAAAGRDADAEAEIERGLALEQEAPAILVERARAALEGAGPDQATGQGTEGSGDTQ